jgi:hypothetical protein
MKRIKGTVDQFRATQRELAEHIDCLQRAVSAA